MVYIINLDYPIYNIFRYFYIRGRAFVVEPYALDEKVYPF